MDSNLHTAVQSTASKEAAAVQLTEDARAREQHIQFMRAYDGHKQWVTRAIKYDDMYVGNQWNAADADKLAAEGRPALTVNLILSTINVMLGDQITGRMDLEYKPRDEGTEQSTFALTKLAMSVLDANQYKWVESMVYADALIHDRGYFDMRVDWTDPMKPCIKIRDLNPLNVIPDPDAQHWDPRRWREVWYTEWVSLDQVELEYGEDIALKLKSLADNGTTYGTDSILLDRQTFGKDAPIYDNTHSSAEKPRIRRIRIIQRQYYVSTRVHYLVHPETGERRQLPLDIKATEAKKLAESMGALLHSVTEQRVKWMVTADRFVLQDSFSPYRAFTILPLFPYFRRGKPFGAVCNLVSPQEQLNKLESQELHIVNTTANSGYMVEQGALHGMTTDELAQQGSKTGIVIPLTPGGLGKIEKIAPNSIPSGIDRCSAKSAGHLKQISGVNDSMLGTEAPEVSGVAMEKKNSVGQVQLAVVSDALNRTRHMVGRQLLDLIKDFFGFEQVVNYTEYDDGGQKPAMRSLTINQIQADGSVLFDTTVGDYDVVISTQPDRDVFNEIQFAKALALRSAGIMVPDHHVILASDLANKVQIAEEAKQAAGFGDIPPEQQEFQRRMQEAEVGGAESKAAKDAALAKQAEATALLNETKAAIASAEPEHKQRALEQDYAKESRSHDVRRELALIAAANKLDQQVLKERLTPKKEAK